MAICLQCGINETGKLEICDECHEQNKSDLKEIVRLQEEGHSPHCANRQVWGDGECECHLYEKGYDPYK